MAHRTFRDEHGRDWDVWEVVPTTVERRMARNSQERPALLERRRVQEARVLVPEALQDGWLAFQHGKERRRLAPIPSEWPEMTSDELLDLLHRAEGKIRTRRLIE
jgi:hypothetical protein